MDGSFLVYRPEEKWLEPLQGSPLPRAAEGPEKVFQSEIEETDKVVIY